MTLITYSVPSMSCGHCQRAVSSQIAAVPGVHSVAVDLGAKLVTVSGEQLEDSAIRAAIEEAGYEAT
jgi:copper chaperone CopZ